MTGIAPLGTLERLSCTQKARRKKPGKSERIHNRVSEICTEAAYIRQPIFIDAEDSWYQDAIDRLAMEMMARFNREEPIVYNTLQMYRTDRLQHLKDARRQAKNEGYMYAVKLVRGAYMEKERERAAEKGYPSPIHTTRADTDADYNAALEYCLKHHKDMSFVAATHNEASTQQLAAAMHDARDRDRPPAHPFLAAIRNGRQHLLRPRQEWLQRLQVRALRPGPGHRPIPHAACRGKQLRRRPHQPRTRNAPQRNQKTRDLSISSPHVSKGVQGSERERQFTQN